MLGDYLFQKYTQSESIAYIKHISYLKFPSDKIFIQLDLRQMVFKWCQKHTPIDIASNLRPQKKHIATNQCKWHHVTSF